MIVYMKSKKTFQTNYKAFAQGWDVPIMASTHERGTIIIPLEGKKDFTGDLIYFDDHLFMIDESSPKDGTVELTVSDMANLFSRRVKYPDDPQENSYGDFIEDVIDREFIHCTDDMYQITYLKVYNSDTTPFEVPKLSDTKLISLTDIIAEARKKGVLFNFYIGQEGEDKNKLVLDISSPITVPHNIVFDDGHAYLDTETFSRVKTAKISVLKARGNNQEGFDETTWYLSKSGDISEIVPEDRAEGDWIYLELSADDDVREKVSEEFKKNISSHKIEFYSDRIYYLWDTVNFTIDGELLQSSVISAYLSSSNKRYLYKCGDLATTLTEKVQKKIS